MRKRGVLLVVFLIQVSFAAYCQKAYESVYYKGETQNISVKFELADGYLGASEIVTTDKKTKKKSRFLPESGAVGDDKTLKFYHYSVSGKSFSDFFMLEKMEDIFDQLPTRISGSYYDKGVSYPIHLSILHYYR